LFLLVPKLSYSQDSDIQLANAYLLKGDKKKAIELYRELAKHEQNNPLIYNNYLNVMLDLGALKKINAANRITCCTGWTMALSISKMVS
jgi:tetratricopeptide (TPR) repeat protein